jgi:hypothetical protein
VAKSSEKFSAINLQILSNIVRDYFPFLLGYPRSPVFTSSVTIAEENRSAEYIMGKIQF